MNIALLFGICDVNHIDPLIELFGIGGDSLGQNHTGQWKNNLKHQHLDELLDME